MKAAGPRWRELYAKLDDLDDWAWANNLNGRWLEIAVRAAQARSALWTKDRSH